MHVRQHMGRARHRFAGVRAAFADARAVLQHFVVDRGTSCSAGAADLSASATGDGVKFGTAGDQFCAGRADVDAIHQQLEELGLHGDAPLREAIVERLAAVVRADGTVVEAAVHVGAEACVHDSSPSRPVEG